MYTTLHTQLVLLFIIIFFPFYSFIIFFSVIADAWIAYQRELFSICVYERHINEDRMLFSDELNC